MSEIPAGRRLIAAAFDGLAGRGRGHWQDGFPFLGLRRPAGGRPGQIRWKGRTAGTLAPMSSLARGLAPDPVIFGSGPSLAGQDLASVPPEGAVLVNGALALAPRLGGARAVVIGDDRFVYRHADMIFAETPADTVLVLSPKVMRALLEHDPRWLRHRPVVMMENLLTPYFRRRLAPDAPALVDVTFTGERAQLSTDPAHGVIAGGTVAFAALQILLALGPRSIGLAGVDIANADAPRFYESTDRTAPSDLLRYRGRILRHMALARRRADALGIRLVCHSPVSALLEIGIPYDPRLEPRDRAAPA